jgi:hypothetical protein
MSWSSAACAWNFAEAAVEHRGGDQLRPARARPRCCARPQGEVVADNLIAAGAGRQADARFDGHGACFLETGGGRAGFASGDFYASPSPAVRMRQPARRWHWGKVLFERR